MKYLRVWTLVSDLWLLMFEYSRDPQEHWQQLGAAPSVPRTGSSEVPGDVVIGPAFEY